MRSCWNLFICEQKFLGERMKAKTCVKCAKFERVAENAGYCHEYDWMISIELAKRQMVCLGIEEEETKKNE